MPSIIVLSDSVVAIVEHLAISTATFLPFMHDARDDWFEFNLFSLKTTYFQNPLAAISRKLYYTNIGYFCISTTRHKVQATPSYESISNSIKVH